MKTIKITRNYYVRVTKQNYIVYKLVEKENGKKVFISPTYHTQFSDALKNVYGRVIKEKLEDGEVLTLKDAITKIDETYQMFVDETTKGDEFIEEIINGIEVDDDPEEETENIDEQEVEEGKDCYGE